jgi:hypothetical protein
MPSDTVKCTRCDKPATVRVGIADPDMPQYPYCDYHGEVMRTFITLSMFPSMRDDFDLYVLAESMVKSDWRVKHKKS